MTDSAARIITDIKLKRSRECFAILDEQAYLFGPIHLIDVLSHHVSRSALVIYLYLLYEQKKAYSANGAYSPVIISIKRLASKSARSRKTIERCLAELERKEFILREQRFKDGKQQPSAICLAIPDNIIKDLVKKPKRRKTKSAITKNFINNMLEAPLTEAASSVSCLTTIEKPAEIAVVVEGIITKGTLEVNSSPKADDKSKTPDEAVTTSATVEQQAYEHYIKLKDELSASGKKPFAANRQAWNKLDKEQQLLIDSYLQKLTATEMSSSLTKDNLYTKADPQKCRTDNIINNCYYNSSSGYLDVTKQNPKPNLTPSALIVNFKNYSKKLTPEYIDSAMRKFFCDNKIPEIVLRNKTIDDVIREIQFHVANRNPATLSALHALNAAKSMVRKGTWQTPRRLSYQLNAEAIKRENAWQQQKAQARAEVNRFIYNYQLGVSL